MKIQTQVHVSCVCVCARVRACVCVRVCVRRAGRGVFGEVFLAKARAIEEAVPETLVLVKSLESREETHRTEFRRELEMFSKTPSHSHRTTAGNLQRNPHHIT